MPKKKIAGLRSTTIYLLDEQHRRLKAITRELQDAEIPDATQSDIMRVALEEFINRWPRGRKLIVRAIQGQEHRSGVPKTP